MKEIISTTKGDPLIIWPTKRLTKIFLIGMPNDQFQPEKAAGDELCIAINYFLLIFNQTEWSEQHFNQAPFL